MNTPRVTHDFGPDFCRAFLPSGNDVRLRRYLLDERMKRALESGDLGDLAEFDTTDKLMQFISVVWKQRIIDPPEDSNERPRGGRILDLPMSHLGFAWFAGVSMTELNEVRRYFRTPDVTALLEAWLAEVTAFRQRFVRH